jgi:hypothetical protein
MDPKIAAPVEAERFNAFRRALSEHLAHKINRRGIAFAVSYRRHDSAATGAHWENRYRSKFAGT